MSILDELAQAQATIHQGGQAQTAACVASGRIATQLQGEPGLAEVGEAWPALRAADQDLGAACGRLDALAQPGGAGFALEQARARWRQGAEDDLRAMCGHLQRAARGLNRPPPDCAS